MADQRTLTHDIEKRFCCFQVVRVEAFGKAIVDGLKQRGGLDAAVLLVPQPSQADRCAQFPGQSALSARPVERLPEVILGCNRRPVRSLQDKKLALEAQYLGYCPALFSALGPCQRPLDRREPISHLTGTT